MKAYFHDLGVENDAGARAAIERAFAAAWRTVSDTEPPPARAREAPDVDWLARWRASVRPVEAAPGLWIAPPVADPVAAAGPVAAANRVTAAGPPVDPFPPLTVVILPGQGFGTGTHPTTRALLAWLAREPTAGSVLDVGTGSGILALAALSLGARRAVGLETDPAAIENAAENRRRNAAGWRGAPLGGRLALVRGSTETLEPGARFDRVLANLDRATLAGLLPELARRVSAGGRLGVAGLLAGEEGEILSLAEAAGLRVADRSVDPDPAGEGAWWSGWLAAGKG